MGKKILTIVLAVVLVFATMACSAITHLSIEDPPTASNLHSINDIFTELLVVKFDGAPSELVNVTVGQMEVYFNESRFDSFRVVLREVEQRRRTLVGHDIIVNSDGLTVREDIDTEHAWTRDIMRVMDALYQLENLNGFKEMTILPEDVTSIVFRRSAGPLNSWTEDVNNVFRLSVEGRRLEPMTSDIQRGILRTSLNFPSLFEITETNPLTGETRESFVFF